MISAALAIGVLGQVSRRTAYLDSLQRGIYDASKADGNYTTALGLVLVACVLVIFVVWLVRRPRRTNVVGCDRLVEATRRLRLGRSELHDLRTVAERAAWSQPVAMLLSPANLAAALEAAERAAQDRDLADRIGCLGRRIFDADLPLSSPTPQAS